jgi:hypothetical protein
MKRALNLLAGAALLCGAAALVVPAGASQAPRPAQPAPPKPTAQAKNIDLVLCLDVSGSMGGLINTAKNRLWDIVTHLAKAQPTPRLRVALYSYGDPKYGAQTGYVRKEIDLTEDLDALYEKLFALRIDGGDEYATRVSVTAINEQKWAEGKDALRVIFVCGNEPANQDPVVSMKEAAEKAKARGVIINTIYCGGADDGDGRSWRDLALLAGGRYATINHDRTHVVVNAPQDKAIAELGVKLNETYVAYGKDGEAKKRNQGAQTTNAYSAGTGVQAGRTLSQNSVLYRCDSWDLVDRCKNDAKFDVKKLTAAELPEVMKKMTPEQRAKYVKDMTAKREQVQKQITELSKQRDAFIREHQRKHPNAAERAFDNAIRETLRLQASPVGINLPRE